MSIAKRVADALKQIKVVCGVCLAFTRGDSDRSSPVIFNPAILANGKYSPDVEVVSYTGSAAYLGRHYSVTGTGLLASPGVRRDHINQDKSEGIAAW